jgi:hypothetical protein
LQSFSAASYTISLLKVSNEDLTHGLVLRNYSGFNVEYALKLVVFLNQRPEPKDDEEEGKRYGTVDKTYFRRGECLKASLVII